MSLVSKKNGRISTIFPFMSVYENLELGMYLVRDKSRVRARIQEIFDLFPRTHHVEAIMAFARAGA